MIHMIGNAHIDPVWLWQWQDGFHEIKATFQSALDRMNETDDFIFTAACAGYYQWIEENAPEMFEQIRKRVAEGRWRIVGGMWVQPDCNIPSGESFARHFLYSQRYFREKFGITVRTGYNVDSFGHSAMLPALLKGAGIDRYVFLRPEHHENPNVPAPLFRWGSPDGSSVNAFRILKAYASEFGHVNEEIETALAAEEKFGTPMMCFYGVGNHGGGPTVQNLSSIHHYQKECQKGSEIIFSDPDAYFDEIEKDGISLPEWKSELQHHSSGCYSATSMIKMLNRKTENALIRCEEFGVLSGCLTAHIMKPLTQAWENLMFNQFHDILCGCCIREAYVDAQNQLGESLSIAAREENAALQKISWRIDTKQGNPARIRSKESDSTFWELNGQGTPVVVFNPHPFEAETTVQLFGGIKHATDEKGREIPVQIVRAARTNRDDKWDSLFAAKVPPMGYRLYWVYLADQGAATHQDDRKRRTPEDNDAAMIKSSELKISDTSLENRRIRACFDPQTGALIHLFLKDSGKDFLSGPALPRLADIEHTDTWAHEIFTFDQMKESFGNAAFEILERGPVRIRLRVTTSVLSSTLIQDYILTENADQLEVHVRLDMQEKFRMLKLCFPTAFDEPKAHAEISYGVIEREPDGCEEIGHRWMEMGNAEGGLAVLNDGKYSFSAIDGELRLTAANTSLYADHYGQEYRDSQCIHADMGIQEFRYALVPHHGSWQSAGLNRRAARFNMALTHITETYHKGDLPPIYSGLRVNQENISVGAIKRAEDNHGFIVRAAESSGIRTTAEISAPMFNRNITVDFNAFEIKTLFFPDDASLPVKELLLTEWEHSEQH